ncbi:ribosome biogenesis GTPase Der [Gammaproteobacteria bacterium]|jgi:GTP-binding protein|nr:ribosome biogenesis GTPase Der [Cryomorphaceae bacterium]MDA9033665.1 ribosome biogenesis GTPase Der [Gammaproteobacteria bacterium]MDA9902837.1 ribosome biogenesis GTPase Der [Gammaproteobacteria bacterium]MDB4849196.1 ribosome biogenesis GTPase Der [Gammaproteobacteria bacterium]MDC0402018.1 ribosome biogenesis GTPase Der [Gammaproteobacteria bacterium]
MFTSIAIIGRPNVGKSTLFNKLTKSRQAIVSDFSGLTKDRNYGYISFGDQKSLIIDTGGIAQDDSILKEDIAEQAWIAAEESNLIIFLLDGSQNLNKEDLDILTRLRKLNKNFITVLNKIDKKSQSLIKEDLTKKGLNDIFEISAEHSRNLIDLRTFIKASLPKEKLKAPEGKKIAVLGRPNAGKSTFINKFIKQDRLIVSEIAGTTIDAISIPFTVNDDDFIFIDTAGIRKGYRNAHKVEYFSYVRAMHSVEECDVVIFICDATEGLVDQDLKIINMICEMGKPVVIAFNKMDLLSKKEKDKLYESKRAQSSFVDDFIKIEISGINGTGFKRLFRITNNVIDIAQKKYTTAALNKLLSKFVLQSAPPSVGGRQLKLKHIHFGGINPTTLIIHSNQDKKIPQNYRKYLENSLREALKLQSIQLKLIFRKSENPFKSKINKLTERQVKKRQRMMKHVRKKK